MQSKPELERMRRNLLFFAGPTLVARDGKALAMTLGGVLFVVLSPLVWLTALLRKGNSRPMGHDSRGRKGYSTGQ